MKVYKVTDPEFKSYGTVLEGYDFTELLAALSKTEIPESGITYVASDASLEACAVAKEMCERGFSSYPIQLGYVNGKNQVMNCLEYHKTGEFNIALDDVILILGHVWDVEGEVLDSATAKAFLVPAGTGVEMYATTLHYAPFSTTENGYRVVCVLPRGTNAPKQPLTVKTFEDKACFGTNKWLFAHPDAPEVADGALVAVTGKNITFSDLED